MNFLEFLKNRCCFIKNIKRVPRRWIHIVSFLLITLSCYMILNVENNFINIKKIGSINMLGISLALFPVLAFINEFFINKSEDYFNKQNYYLGYNLKKFELYNNNIIKLFDKIEINKFILTSFIISCLISFSKLEFECLILIKAKILIESIEKLLYSIWLTCIVSYIFYIIVILYVILYFSKAEFYKGYVYDSYNTDIRNQIEKLITKEYEEKLKNIITNSNNIEKDIEEFTRKLFKRASIISNNYEECESFIHCCYHHEFEVINNIKDEYKYIDEYLSRVSKYYLSKWNQIGNIIYFLSNIPDVMLHIASVDYGVINYIENEYCNTKKISDYFYGSYIFNYNGEKYTTRNYIQSRIISIIGLCFTDKKFINGIRFPGSFTQVFTMISSKDKSYKFSDEKIIFFEYLLFMSYRSILFDNQSKLFLLRELDYIVDLLCFDNYIDIINNMKNKFRTSDYNYGVEVVEFLK